MIESQKGLGTRSEVELPRLMGGWRRAIQVVG